MIRAALLLSLIGCARQPAKVVIKDAPTFVFSQNGQEAKLRGVVYDKDGVIMEPNDPLVWTSSHPEVLTVKDGVLRADRSGTSTITLKAGDAKAELLLRVAIVGSVRIEPEESQTLKLGQTTTLKAVVLDDHNEPMEARVIWSAPSHAVDVADGVVTAQATGTAQVTAEAGNKSASVRIVVK